MQYYKINAIIIAIYTEMISTYVDDTELSSPIWAVKAIIGTISSDTHQLQLVKLYHFKL